MNRNQFEDKVKGIYEGDMIRLHISYTGISETEIRQGTYVGMIEKKVAFGLTGALKMKVTSNGRIKRGEEEVKRVKYTGSYIGSNIDRIFILSRTRRKEEISSIVI